MELYEKSFISHYKTNILFFCIHLENLVFLEIWLLLYVFNPLFYLLFVILLQGSLSIDGFFVGTS